MSEKLIQRAKNDPAWLDPFEEAGTELCVAYSALSRACDAMSKAAAKAGGPPEAKLFEAYMGRRDNALRVESLFLQ